MVITTPWCATSCSAGTRRHTANVRIGGREMWKRTVLSLLILCATVSVLPADPDTPSALWSDRETQSLRRFYSLSELRKSVTNATAFSAGGTLSVLSLDGTKVYVADRSATVGMISSAITVYVVEKGVFVPRLIIPSLHSCRHKCLAVGPRLIITRTVSDGEGAKEVEVASIHKDGLLLPIQQVGRGLSEELRDPELDDNAKDANKVPEETARKLAEPQGGRSPEKNNNDKN